MPETLDPAAEAELAYRAGVHRAQERAYQDWAAEFDYRVKKLLRQGMGAEQAGRHVMLEMEEVRRQLQADFADAVLLEEAEHRRAVAAAAHQDPDDSDASMG